VILEIFLSQRGEDISKWYNRCYAGVLYMKNMVMQHWEESDEAKQSAADLPEFIIHENDQQIVRDNIVEAVIAASNPVRSAHWQYVALVVVLWCPALSSSSTVSVTAVR